MKTPQKEMLKDDDIAVISKLIANELISDMRDLFVKICSDKRVLATVWSDNLLDEGDQCAIARRAMEKAIEMACDLVDYDNLPAVSDCWVWETTCK